jgi:hypothetical protein
MLADNLLKRLLAKVFNVENEPLDLHEIRYIQRFFYIFYYFYGDREAMRMRVCVDTKSEQRVHQSEKIETDG